MCTIGSVNQVSTDMLTDTRLTVGSHIGQVSVEYQPSID